MQRKDIKVGAAYAVTNERSPKRRHHADKVKGTVVALDGKYQRKNTHGHRTHEASDGIVVRFDEPVVFQYGSINTLASLTGKNNNYTREWQRRFRKEAVTEHTFGDGVFFYSTWEEEDERQRRFAEQRERWNREADEVAAAFEPVLAATMDRLREAGFADAEIHGDFSAIRFEGGSIGIHCKETSDGKRPVGFGEARIKADALLDLLERARPLSASRRLTDA